MPTLRQLVDELSAREGVDVVRDAGGWFFFHDPARDLDPAQRVPFATIITTDAYDGASDLERRGLHRINLGPRLDTYRARFGEPPGWGEGPLAVVPGPDYTRVDTLMPHPQYALMGWVCIVAPSDASWKALRPLVEEAHEEGRRRWRARKKG